MQVVELKKDDIVRCKKDWIHHSWTCTKDRLYEVVSIHNQYYNIKIDDPHNENIKIEISFIIDENGGEDQSLKTFNNYFYTKKERTDRIKRIAKTFIE